MGVALPEMEHMGKPRAIELFAGVGGFRLGLERGGWDVVWSNQWEPSTRRQHASEIYTTRFGDSGHTNRDIQHILDDVEAGTYEIPSHDLLVGGFPCQDYSVARVLSQASGIVGQKGVLWWEILRLLHQSRPRFVVLENVDRLLKSPATQRGRDFAVMLSCLSHEGYVVEWRVLNAAEYGFPQKRRRVFIVGYRSEELPTRVSPTRWITQDGVLARAFPVREANEAFQIDTGIDPDIVLSPDLKRLSDEFGAGAKITPFSNSGLLVDGNVWTRRVSQSFEDRSTMLSDVLESDGEVPERFFISDSDLHRWKYLKGSKNEDRIHRASGTPYHYSEGAIPFPDAVDQPARTILTGEGGSTPSRFKHVIRTGSGRLRRLTPVELERLNGFPPGWTDVTGISDGRRAYMMGNALVVGLVESIGEQLLPYAKSISTSSGEVDTKAVAVNS